MHNSKVTSISRYLGEIRVIGGFPELFYIATDASGKLIDNILHTQRGGALAALADYNGLPVKFLMEDSYYG